MFDYFTEHIISRKKTPIDYLIALVLIIAGVAVTLLALSTGILAAMIIGQIAVLILFGMWWGIYLLATSRSIEFEYIVTNGELDIDKIIARRRRKRLISLKSKEIELITPQSEYTGTCETTLDVSSHKDGDEVYILTTVTNGTRTKIIFNPSEKMLKIFKKFRPQNVNWSE